MCAVGLRAHAIAGSEEGCPWSDRVDRDHHDVIGGCSREPTFSFDVTPGASPRPCPFDVLPVGVRVRVAVAFGRPATPAQIGSIEAVSNEVAVDKKSSCAPVRMKLGGIARAHLRRSSCRTTPTRPQEAPRMRGLIPAWWWRA
jgi:hypothetical protein